MEDGITITRLDFFTSVKNKKIFFLPHKYCRIFLIGFESFLKLPFS